MLVRLGSEREMDAYLDEIVETAEAGKPVVRLRLITAAGDWITGTPCSSERFRDLSYGESLAEIKRLPPLPTRKERKAGPTPERVEVAKEQVGAAFGEFGAESDEFDALNLEEAFLAFGGRGDGLHLPVVRVPLQSICAWWVAGETYVRPTESRSSWIGGGITFPLGN
jgi:hypothetical protein